MASELELKLKAKARARARARAQQSPERGPFDRFARGFGGGLVDLVGIVPGAAMEAGNLTGLTDFENTSGSDFLKRQLEPLGLTGAPGEDLGTIGQVGQAIGQYGVPGVAGTAGLARRGAVGAVDASKNIGLLRGVNQGGQVARTGASRAPAATTAGRVVDDMAAGAAAAPTATGISEVAAAGGEALGREAAEGSFGDGWQADVGGIIGGILGGLGPTGVVAGARRVGQAASDNIPVVGLVRRAGERLFRVGPSQADRVRASKRLRAVAEGAAERGDAIPAQRNLRNTDDVDPDLLTPAQQTGDSGIMSLAARERADDPKILASWRAQAEDNMAELRNRLKNVTGDEAERISRQYGQDVDDMVVLASANAERRLANMTPNQRRSEASTVLRSELNKAYRTARSEESQLWDMVPDDVKHKPAGLVSKYAEIRRQLTPENAENMPSKAKKFLSSRSSKSYFARDKEGKVQIDEDGNPILRAIPVKRLHNLRNSLLTEAREARSGDRPNLNRSRLANEMAEAVLDEINSVDAVSEPLTIARQFSRHLNDRFTRGPVGDVLQTKARGDVVIPEEMTLDRTVGRGGVEAERSAKAFKRALESPNEAVRGAFTDFLKDDFQKLAAPNGEFNRAGAQRFMRKYKELLETQPALRAQFTQAIEDGNLASVAGSVQDGAARVLSKNNPAAEIRRIRQMANRDKTGAVWASFRRGLSNEIFERARVRNPRGDVDTEIISGSALLEMLDGEKAGPALKQAFNKTELANLRRIANTAHRIERDIGARQAAGFSTEEPNFLARIIAGFSGALGGAAASRAAGGGAAGLKSANMASAAAENLLRKSVRVPVDDLLHSAMKNKRVLDDLLAPVTKPGYESRVVPRINAWLVGIMDEMDNEEDGVEPAPQRPREVGRRPGPPTQ